VEAGAAFFYALSTGAQIHSWGYNGRGQLGLDHKFEPITTPQSVTSITDVADLDGGYHHTCVVKSTDGTVWCVGRNDYSQLGDGSTDESEFWVPVQGL